jgi:hypothetical protein
MPLPDDVVRVRLVFDLWRDTAPFDIAVMGFHMRRNHTSGVDTDWEANTQEIASKVWQKWATNVTAKGFWSTGVKLSRVDAYHLDNNARTLHKGTQGQDATHVAWAGASGQPFGPWDVACAVSLYAYQPGTFDPLAKYKRGRFYLPPFNNNVYGTAANAGRFDRPSFAATLVPALSAFLNDVHDMSVGATDVVATDSMRLCVASQTRSLASDVVAMRLGMKPDSQSRRGAKLPEEFIDSAITV